jgi:hypothetical protein
MDANQIDPAVDHRHVEQLEYTVPRLTLPIPAVREFQKRYETAVPDLPLAAVADLVSRRSPCRALGTPTASSSTSATKSTR